MTAIASFNPTDSKFQLNAEFKPDKEGNWLHPAEEDGWVHAHNSLRDEMRSLVIALEATDGRDGELQEWEVACIRKAWQAHETHVHSHHTNEDNIMVPYLKTRFHYPDKYEADHEGLVAKLDKITTLVNELKAGTGASEVLKEMSEYEALMKPHLLQEEVECLPLCRAYFTPKEIAPKIQEIIGNGPKVEMGSFIHTMGVDHFRKKFMKQEGIPFFVWYMVFCWRLKIFEKEFLAPLDALKSGVKPAKM